MDRRILLTDALEAAFSPQMLEVLDDSHKHAGHAGARPEGQTHFTVRIISPAFAGKSRVEIHRLVNAAAKPAFDVGLHALQIDAKDSASC